MGQTAGLIDDIAPAAAIVERIVREAEVIIRERLTSFVTDDEPGGSRETLPPMQHRAHLGEAGAPKVSRAGRPRN
jgi:hypothetical protein